MKRSFIITVTLSAFFAALLLSPASGTAGVRANDFPLPALILPAPPPLFVIPGAYVYYPPDVQVEIFFYHGYWYRPYRGGWYIANGYNGPWQVVGPKRTPRALLNMPPTYRRVPPGHERMPFGTVQKNWRTWEKERRWDRHEGGNNGPGRGKGKGRGRGKHDRD
jgi:hypothetical protein